MKKAKKRSKNPNRVPIFSTCRQNPRRKKNGNQRLLIKQVQPHYITKSHHEVNFCVLVYAVSSNAVLQALKALALIRAERVSEAEPFINEVEKSDKNGFDENTLQALCHCFKVQWAFVSCLLCIVKEMTRFSSLFRLPIIST